MEIERSVVVAGPPGRAFALVDDLSSYPSWMALVHAVDVAGPDAGRPAWEVELQAQVGPFARSKRLRMVRTVHEPDGHVVFERVEVDGRTHSPWVLDVRLEPIDGGPHETSVGVRRDASSRVTMFLHYGGSLWTGAVLQRVLDDHVERGAEALRDRCESSDDSGT